MHWLLHNTQFCIGCVAMQNREYMCAGALSTLSLPYLAAEGCHAHQLVCQSMVGNFEVL